MTAETHAQLDVAFVIAAIGSTVMHCNHVSRAVGEAGLCMTEARACRR